MMRQSDGKTGDVAVMTDEPQPVPTMILRLIPGVLLLLCVSAASVHAQAGDDDLDAEIRELLQITGSGEMGVTMMNQMIDSFREATPEVPDSFWASFMQEVSADALVDLTIPIYRRHFTPDEIRAMLTFYRTPEGQSIVSKLPLVMQESYQAGEVWGQEIARRALARLLEAGYEI